MDIIDIYADNPEVTLEYMIAVMQAAKAGGTVQWKRTTDALYGFWENTKCPNWDWLATKYRISPDFRPKKTVPMERDDYPPFFWLRKMTPAFHSATHTFPFRIHLSGCEIDGQFIRFENLVGVYEYSTDRKTWLPCTKEVSA